MKMGSQFWAGHVAEAKLLGISARKYAKDHSIFCQRFVLLAAQIEYNAHGVECVQLGQGVAEGQAMPG